MALIASQFMVAIITDVILSEAKNLGSLSGRRLPREQTEMFRFTQHDRFSNAMVWLLRFVSDLENDLSARVTSRHLLLCFHRVRKRECLRHDYFDFPVVDQFADFSQLF